MEGLKLTDGALAELRKVRDESKDEDGFPDEPVVRVGVMGGGCSGFQYDMRFVEAAEIDEKDDYVEEYDGLKVVTDKKSLLYLDGATLDWQDELNQRGFKFENPNAVKNCGCGQSFQA